MNTNTNYYLLSKYCVHCHCITSHAYIKIIGVFSIMCLVCEKEVKTA